MILNNPIAVAIDVANSAYSVNLLLSWIPNQSPTDSIPNMKQTVTGTPPTQDLFVPAWLDTFDVSSIRNVSMPTVKAISGVVAFGINSASGIAGPFFIMCQSSGYFICIQPTPGTYSQAEHCAVSFCLPIIAPSNASITFGQCTATDGHTVGCANLCLLTYDPVSYYYGGA